MDEALTITTAAEQYGVAPALIKKALGLKPQTPGKQELTEEQVVELESASLTEVDAPKAMPALLTYYWHKIKGASVTIGRGGDLPSVTRRAKNGVLVLNPASDDDAVIIDYLEKHPNNAANGGNKFAQFEPYVAGKGSVASKMDELIQLPLGTLQQMAAEKIDSPNGLIQAANMSVGEMIELVMGLGK